MNNWIAGSLRHGKLNKRGRFGIAFKLNSSLEGWCQALSAATDRLSSESVRKASLLFRFRIAGIRGYAAATRYLLRAFDKLWDASICFGGHCVCHRQTFAIRVCHPRLPSESAIDKLRDASICFGRNCQSRRGLGRFILPVSRPAGSPTPETANSRRMLRPARFALPTQ